MPDELTAPYLVTMLPPEQAPQTEILGSGHHYTRDVEHQCVHVWSHDVPAMRARGYREATEAQAEHHRARRERSLPGPHLEALRAAQVDQEQRAQATPTESDPVVQDAAKEAQKAEAAQADTAATTAKSKK